MPRGNIAKQAVIDKIIACFGEDYVATVDGKVYVWQKENGEKLQIAISLTCPKNMVEPNSGSKMVSAAALDFGGGGGWDFEAMDQTIAVPAKSAEISQEELNNIEEMMRALNLL